MKTILRLYDVAVSQLSTANMATGNLDLELDLRFVEAVRQSLSFGHINEIDCSMLAYFLRLPSYDVVETELSSKKGKAGVDPIAICRVRSFVKYTLAKHLEKDFHRVLG